MTQAPYTPPKVCSWNLQGGRFGGINRPIAGATHENSAPQRRESDYSA
jgi:GST-like protein